jgi:hypothetical protein
MHSRTHATMPHPTRDAAPVILRTYDSRTQPDVTLAEITAHRQTLADAGVESYAMLRDVGRYMVVEIHAARQQLTDARARRGMAPPPPVEPGDDWTCDDLAERIEGLMAQADAETRGAA